jgi:RNA polymerase sigma factor (TIGR02999 family)
VRLVGSADVRWDGRAHFFGAAALAMRRILVERARQKSRIKHGGNVPRADVDVEHLAQVEGEPEPESLLALDSALEKLAAMDQRKHEVVMLRYFAGLSIEDTAQAVGVSPATVKNDWVFARAWLKRAIAQADEQGSGRGA